MAGIQESVLHYHALRYQRWKIWVQQNMTDVDVGQELVDMGVSKQEIILGLHPPYKRPYTGYGVA
jgi:XisI protein